ncbi:MAG TPA: hypothetical protein VFB66_08465 [Tepidisphaeraceae bacterium]|nr:hypothetical protein [Tepidisphaeraceae bacterium]
MDEDLRRFDPLVACFARYSPDGDPRRIATAGSTSKWGTIVRPRAIATPDLPLWLLVEPWVFALWRTVAR